MHKNLKNLLLQNFSLWNIAIFSIFILGLFLRINDFTGRISFGQDNTRDIIIAQQALLRHTFPSIGSFSSAGPFVFGPAFLWIIMLSYAILPFWVYAPYLITVIGGLLTVGILGYCGYLLGGRRLGLIVLFFAAVSPQLSQRSLVLSQHTWVGLAASSVFMLYILLWQKKQIRFAFLLGACLGFAISFHYQSLNLLLFLPFLFFIPSFSIKKKITGLVFAMLGMVLPLLPLLIWDSQQQFANIRNILDYFLIGEYRIYVPNSWRLFIFTYVPLFWSNVIGGYSIIGFFCFISIFLFGSYSIYKKKISSLMLILLIFFAILLFLNRFYRGERSEGYLLYLDPFIIIFTGWLFAQLYKLMEKKIENVYVRIGTFICIMIIFAGLNILDAPPFSYSNTNNYEAALRIVLRIKHALPNKKFTIYDYKASSLNEGQTMSLAFSEEGLTAKDGVPIGIVDQRKKIYFPHAHPIASYMSLDIFYVDKNMFVQHRKDWFNVNPESIYDMLIGWSNKHALQSNFHFDSYLRNALHW